jgi:hypothetical protein
VALIEPHQPWPHLLTHQPWPLMTWQVRSVALIDDSSPRFGAALSMGDQFGYSSLVSLPPLSGDGSVTLAAGAKGDSQVATSKAHTAPALPCLFSARCSH